MRRKDEVYDEVMVHESYYSPSNLSEEEEDAIISKEMANSKPLYTEEELNEINIKF